MRKESIAVMTVLAAGLATASAAQPVYPRLPVFVYDTPAGGTASTAIDRECTQLEHSAGLDEDACGTVPLSIVVKLKAEADQDGDDD